MARGVAGADQCANPEPHRHAVRHPFAARLAALAILVLVIGLYPNLLLEKITPSTEAVIDHVVEQTGFEVPEPGRLEDVYVAGDQ